ncbi:MAG TPA: hypothetical protein VG891_02000 [Rhizomicrobium sp.]|nr:hypothetical protein [Rhizomicrobium sp.]
MQISPASLLAAQQQAPAQQKPQKSVFGSFLNASEVPPKEAGKTAFEPAEFSGREVQDAAPASQQSPAQGFRKPGSTLDIRV